MEESAAEVLIIGAGPTGLMTACELVRHGVRPRIIDQCAEPHTQTRATGVQPGALEVMARAGLAEAFVERSVPVMGLRVLDSAWREAFVVRPVLPETPYPFTCSLAQWQTEEILNARLAAEGIPVERGVTASEIVSNDDGARVVCERADGSSFVVEAEYLIGAGGAHSPVREALHENLEGITYPKRYFVADIRTTGVHQGDHLLNVAVTPAGMLMMAELPLGRTLLVCDLPEGIEPDGEIGLDDVLCTLAGHLVTPIAADDVRWASVYRTHRRMAPKFRIGRSFLAGDAAHLCSPLGGEGMNSGFLDAASLAWMLGAVLRRQGRPELLDAYDPERQDIARQVLASSEGMYDFYYSLAALAGRGEPIRALPEDPTRHVTSPAMLDLALRESPILGFHGTRIGFGMPGPGNRFVARTRLKGPLHHLLVFADLSDGERRELSSRWAHALEVVDGRAFCEPSACGVSPGGAALVRPDGYLGFLLDPWDATAFDGYFSRLFRPADNGVQCL
ncbi:MAG: FAD-dependent monooxygenase [Terrimicrobiaceae bacterium]|nr:FAD-dependent monooxygenase [Terrimicrobiaceae bacterium]